MGQDSKFFDGVDDVVSEAEIILKWEFILKTREAVESDDPEAIVFWTKKLFGIKKIYEGQGYLFHETHNGELVGVRRGEAQPCKMATEKTKDALSSGFAFPLRPRLATSS